MKQKAAKILDVAIHSINLLLINYALSNMMALFRSSVLYILFFTSEMWVFAQYRKSIETLSNSKTLANLLLVICAAIEIGLLYFIGIVSGKLVPFNQSKRFLQRSNFYGLRMGNGFYYGSMACRRLP